MADPSGDHRELRSRVAAAILFACAAGTLVLLFWTFLNGHLLANLVAPAELAARMSPLVFLCACVLVFVRHRLGYGLGIVAGLTALPWFIQIEFSPGTWGSWETLIYEHPLPFMPGEELYLTFTKLKILSVFLVAAAVGCSVLRLLPARWSARQLPLRRRTWPAFAAAFLLLTVWIGYSVTPYHRAGYDHPTPMELRILHVEKRGLRFHEVTVVTSRDGRAWVWRNDRRLFQFRFESRMAQTSLYETLPTAHERAWVLSQEPGLWNLQTASPASLRSWNAEGWYVVLRDSRILTFTSELGTAPPKELTDWFHQVERLPLRYGRPYGVRDLCFGFCYDPVAGLGFQILPQRMRLLRPNTPGSR
jgi:hypothetical protein